MKQNSPLIPSPLHSLLAGAPRRRVRILIFATFCLASGAALWAQSRRTPDTLDERVERTFSDLAILDPAAATAFLDLSKTPEDFAAEARVRLAITDPAAFAALYAPRDAAQLAAHDKAVYDFTHPFEAAAELEQRKDAAYR